MVNGVSYNAANQLLGMTFNGIGETRSYNVLNQLTNVHAGSGLNLTYNYPTGADNGKISSMYNAVSGETVTYTYDSLNRIATAGGSGWGEAYTFDGFGNLTAKTVTAGSGPSMSVPVDPTHNQIEGLGGYDANGNTFTASAAYDVENHIYALVGESPYTSYSYDAQNKRVFTYTSGSMDTYGNPINYLVVLYSVSGQKLGTYQISTCDTSMLCSLLKTSDQYFGGRRLASMDQLGSVGTYYPWGEAKGTTNPQDAWSYATYWRDSVTGLDYANNRYYSNAYGRFMTPDPYHGTSGGGPGNPRDPQSWNRYAYTSGDPVNRLDPTGLLWEDVCDFDGFDASCGGGDGDEGGQDGGGGGADPLRCWFGIPVPLKALWQYLTPADQPAGYYFVLPVTLPFGATGGDGSYTWAITQYISELVTVTTSVGRRFIDRITIGIETTANQADNVNGPSAYFYDQPGIDPGNRGTGIISANFFFTDFVTVSSGGQTVDCPAVEWEAGETIILKNGKVIGASGSAHLVSP